MLRITQPPVFRKRWLSAREASVSKPPYDFYNFSYSLTPPIVIPTTKYFCTNGYTIRIGNVATTVIEERIVTGVTIAAADPEEAATAIALASAAELLWFWLA